MWGNVQYQEVPQYWPAVIRISRLPHLQQVEEASAHLDPPETPLQEHTSPRRGPVGAGVYFCHRGRLESQGDTSSPHRDSNQTVITQ